MGRSSHFTHVSNFSLHASQAAPSLSLHTSHFALIFTLHTCPTGSAFLVIGGIMLSWVGLTVRRRAGTTVTAVTAVWEPLRRAATTVTTASSQREEEEEDMGEMEMEEEEAGSVSATTDGRADGRTDGKGGKGPRVEPPRGRRRVPGRSGSTKALTYLERQHERQPTRPWSRLFGKRGRAVHTAVHTRLEMTPPPDGAADDALDADDNAGAPGKTRAVGCRVGCRVGWQDKEAAPPAHSDKSATPALPRGCIRKPQPLPQQAMGTGSYPTRPSIAKAKAYGGAGGYL